MMIEKIWMPIICVMICLKSFAITDTIYIDAFGNSVSKAQASSYLVIDTNGTQVLAKTFTMSNSLLKIQTFTGKSLAIRHGEAKYYDEAGRLVSCGRYTKGAKSGEWKYYSLNTNKIKQLENYLPNGMMQKVVYDTLSGNIKYAGMLTKDSMRHGEWLEYYFRSDSIEWRLQYNHGEKTGEQVQYFRTGERKRIENFIHGDFVNGIQYNESGHRIKYTPAFEYPNPKIKIGVYLRSAAPCCHELLKTQSIVLKCLISEDGTAKEWTVVTGMDSVCKKSLLSACQKIKKWTPAKKDGVAINYWYSYTLQNYAPRE